MTVYKNEEGAGGVCGNNFTLEPGAKTVGNGAQPIVKKMETLMSNGSIICFGNLTKPC